MLRTIHTTGSIKMIGVWARTSEELVIDVLAMIQEEFGHAAIKRKIKGICFGGYGKIWLFWYASGWGCCRDFLCVFHHHRHRLLGIWLDWPRLYPWASNHCGLIIIGVMHTCSAAEYTMDSFFRAQQITHGFFGGFATRISAFINQPYGLLATYDIADVH